MDTESGIPADPRALFGRAADLLVRVASSIDAEQMHGATPADMDVAELLDHVGMAVARAIAAAERRPLPEWPTEGFSLGDDPIAALRDHVAAAKAAWDDDATLEGTVQQPWAELPAGHVLAGFVNELTVHTWDLAQASGQDPAFDDEVVACGHALMRQQVPVAERSALWERYQAQEPGVPFEPPFADAVPVPDDAPAIDRLLGWNGRQP